MAKRGRPKGSTNKKKSISKIKTIKKSPSRGDSDQKFSFDLPTIEYLAALQYYIRAIIQEKMLSITTDPMMMSVDLARKVVKELGLEKYEGFLNEKQ